jgi:hypothetical protein
LKRFKKPPSHPNSSFSGKNMFLQARATMTMVIGVKNVGHIPGILRTGAKLSTLLFRPKLHRRPAQTALRPISSAKYITFPPHGQPSAVPRLSE